MFFPALSPWRCILVDTDTARRTRGFAARQLRASCHQRAPEPCSSVCSFVERSSPFSSSVCPSCLSKTLLHLLWIFFPCISQIGCEPALFTLTSIVVHATKKMPCTHQAYFFVWIEKFDLVRLLPCCNQTPVAGAVSEEAWDHFEGHRSSVCNVLCARLVTNTMSLGAGVWGRGGSCVAMTIQIAINDSLSKSITFFKGEKGGKKWCKITAVEIRCEFQLQ